MTPEQPTRRGFNPRATKHHEKMKLTKSKLKQIIRLAENGNSVTLLVCKALPQANESEIDNAIETVFHCMEFPHE